MGSRLHLVSKPQYRNIHYYIISITVDQKIQVIYLLVGNIPLYSVLARTISECQSGGGGERSYCSVKIAKCSRN